MPNSNEEPLGNNTQPHALADEDMLAPGPAEDTSIPGLPDVPARMRGYGGHDDHGKRGEIRRLALWTAVPAAVAALLLIGHMVRPFGRPAKVVRKALAALAAGDAETLRNEERLGFQKRAEREIKRRGEAEYARVLAIFDKEAGLGDREYRRIRKKLADLGEKDFKKLSKDEQRAVKEASRRQFVADKGWPLLGEDEQKQLVSPETVRDRAKMRAAAIAAGLPTMPETFRTAVEGIDLSSDEVAKDKRLAKFANQCEKAGMIELQSALQSLDSATATELARLSPRERMRIESGSYAKFVLEHGLAATDDKMRARANLTQMLDDDAPEAWALRRTFGFKELDMDSRKQIETLDYDKFVAEKRDFIDKQGMRLWGERLRFVFNDDCCKTTTVRYLGDSGRSLGRNSFATVALEFGTPPPRPVKPKHDTKADKAEADKDKDKDPRDRFEDSIDDGKHLARRYVGQTVKLDYRWGSWSIVGFGAGSEDEDAVGAKAPAEEVVKAALGAFQSFGANSGLSGLILFGVLGAMFFVLVLRKRKAGPTLTSTEIAVGGVMLALATLQIGLQGQATLDDLWFTPIYLALPIWVGASRGAESGLVAGFVAGVSLVIASTVAGVPTWASVSGDGLLLGQHLLATVFLATTGALAGRLLRPAELPIALPIAWLLYFAAIDRSQLASLTVYAHVMMATALTGAGLLVERLGLLQKLVAKVTQSPLEDV